MATTVRKRRATTIRASGLPEDALEAIHRAEKRSGKGAVLRGDQLPRCNHIPTGSFILDLALLGGFPQSFPTMAYGKESTGKSTLLLKGLAQYQKKNPDRIVGLIDSEGLYDPDWGAKLGVDTTRMLVTQPETGEEAVDFFEDWLQIPSMGVVLIDSIPGCIPMQILQKSAEDDTMAQLPRLMGKLCQKWIGTGNAEKRKGHFVTPWMVNQYRMKVGFVLGSPYTLPGGRQINHIPTTKIKLALAKTVMGKDSMGIDVPEYDEQLFKLEKTKHGASIKEGAWQLILNPDNEAGLEQGAYDNVHQIMTYGKKMGFITGGGSSWKCLTKETNSTKFGRLSEISEFLQEHEEERDTLARSIISHQREMKGLNALPPDGYLTSHIGRLVKLKEVS